MGLFNRLKSMLGGKKQISETELKAQQHYKEGMKKTRGNLLTQLQAVFSSYSNVNEELFDELEEIFITADIGVQTVVDFIDQLKETVKEHNVTDPKELQRLMVDKLFEIYVKGEIVNSNLRMNKEGLTVILFVGVNGVGKTTSIAKIAHQLKGKGKSVLLAAGDTFRAGAIEQLQVWGDRVGVDVVALSEGSDPSAVMYDAIKEAKERKVDVLLCDTAGRLQNKVNLMKELEKIKRVIEREVPGAPHDTLLVIDATTGQNGMSQAKAFLDATDVSGVILTKLDGTAKGGIVLAIRNEIGIPIKFVGLGEKAEDLVHFDIEQYIYGLFADLFEEE
ncbi:MAG: signal recognition particle-docking protein FtsY [Turicibacter sp.]